MAQIRLDNEVLGCPGLTPSRPCTPQPPRTLSRQGPVRMGSSPLHHLEFHLLGSQLAGSPPWEPLRALLTENELAVLRGRR